MQKVAIILFVWILAGACSVGRKMRNEASPVTGDNGSVNVFERVIKQNFTSSSFFIQKADIEIITKNDKKKYLGSIKFKYPDEFLISLKSRTGIEGARIYINKDSVIVNDRINKIMYFGTALELKRKFGLNQGLLPLIFGDMVVDNGFTQEEGKCVDNKIKIDRNIRGVSMNYNIDCKRSKITQIILGNNKKDNINISYSNFLYLNSSLIPRCIDIEAISYDVKVRIKIIKTEYPWNGNVRFVPGKGYEIIEIL